MRILFGVVVNNVHSFISVHIKLSAEVILLTCGAGSVDIQAVVRFIVCVRRRFLCSLVVQEQVFLKIVW